MKFCSGITQADILFTFLQRVSNMCCLNRLQWQRLVPSKWTVLWMCCHIKNDDNARKFFHLVLVILANFCQIKLAKFLYLY